MMKSRSIAEIAKVVHDHVTEYHNLTTDIKPGAISQTDAEILSWAAKTRAAYEIMKPSHVVYKASFKFNEESLCQLLIKEI